MGRQLSSLTIHSTSVTDFRSMGSQRHTNHRIAASPEITSMSSRPSGDNLDDAATDSSDSVISSATEKEREKDAERPTKSITFGNRSQNFSLRIRSTSSKPIPILPSDGNITPPSGGNSPAVGLTLSYSPGTFIQEEMRAPTSLSALNNMPHQRAPMLYNGYPLPEGFPHPAPLDPVAEGTLPYAVASPADILSSSVPTHADTRLPPWLSLPQCQRLWSQTLTGMSPAIATMLPMNWRANKGKQRCSPARRSKFSLSLP